MTGIEEITEERFEQINKHGFDVSNDQYYSKGELMQAAKFCLDPLNESWPNGWDEHYKLKIQKKSLIQRIRVAGAFYAAEIDRLKALA